MRYKQFNPTDLEINKGNREILCVASSNAIDRDNEIVLPSGLRTKGVNMAGRPILWAHNRELPPIGSILWMKPQGDKVLCKYRLSDKTEFAREVFDLIQDDCLRFHSVGFEVFDESAPTPQEIKANPDWQSARNVVREWECLELSLCPVPCNPEADLVAKGISETTRKILGSDWEIKDCWEWETKAVEPEAQVEAPAPVVIPRPTFARVVKRKSKDEMILEAIKRHTAEELIARIKGRA